MAKIKLNPAVAAMSGKLGDIVHRQLWGQQVTSRLPDFSQRQLSEKQRAQISRFATGGRKWNGLPDQIKARYKARARELQMPPCGLYQKTSAQPPTVEEIDLSQYTGQAGQIIGVAAADLVDVAAVDVIIREAGGSVLESGPAARPADGDPFWLYQTTATASQVAGLTVEARAVNWPGQRANRLQLLGVPTP